MCFIILNGLCTAHHNSLGICHQLKILHLYGTFNLSTQCICMGTGSLFVYSFRRKGCPLRRKIVFAVASILTNLLHNKNDTEYDEDNDSPLLCMCSAGRSCLSVVGVCVAVSLFLWDSAAILTNVACHHLKKHFKIIFLWLLYHYHYYCYYYKYYHYHYYCYYYKYYHYHYHYYNYYYYHYHHYYYCY